MSCPKRWRCHVCGDLLIHQWNRGRHESSSAFGQFIHDRVTSATTVADADHTFLYRESNVFQLHYLKGKLPTLRVLEHKQPQLEPGGQQREVMHVWAELIESAVFSGKLSPHSGVFLVYASPPFTEARVCRFTGRAIGVGREFGDRELIAWLEMSEATS